MNSKPNFYFLLPTLFFTGVSFAENARYSSSTRWYGNTGTYGITTTKSSAEKTAPSPAAATRKMPNKLLGNTLASPAATATPAGKNP